MVDQDEPFEVWTGYRGRFNQLMLGLTTPDYMERDVYCCGPEPFMRGVRETLQSLGFDMGRYHQENFTAPVEQADDPPPPDVAPDPAAVAELVFARSGRTVGYALTDTILQAAKSAGLNLPSGCTFGVCGTCKVRKTAGEVHMVHNGGITDEDIEAGWILARCSKPLGRVEIVA